MSTGITPLTPEQEEQNEKQATHEGYLHRVIEEADVTVNVATGGYQDETISSRLARDAAEHKVAGEVGSKILDVFQKNHGAQAVAGDLGRAKVIESLEDNSGILPAK
jgi:hypothetical protein